MTAIEAPYINLLDPAFYVDPGDAGEIPRPYQGPAGAVETSHPALVGDRANPLPIDHRQAGDVGNTFQFGGPLGQRHHHVPADVAGGE